MPLAWGFAVAVALVLALAWGVFQVQVTLAGFLSSESVWSKSQKQAVIDLDNYAARGNPHDLDDFKRNYALLEADRWARDAIISGHYDMKSVQRVFRAGNILPSADRGMTFMLEHLSGMPYMAGAIGAWRSTDDSIRQLDDIAGQLQSDYANGSPSHAEISRQRARIDAINAYIEPRTNFFALQMVSGAVWLGRLLFGAVLLALFTVALLWLSMARRVLDRIRGSEERYRLLFESAAVAIAMVDESTGCILDSNRLAAEWTGHDPDSLNGARFDDLFVSGSTHAVGPALVAMLHGPDGLQRPVEMQVSHAAWGRRTVRQVIIRDISERVALERERRVAAEALASIAEGVIIADADRQVISVNAAHMGITGYNAQMLQGRRFDELRRMPDGSPLQAAIWSGIAGGSHWSGEVLGQRADGSTYPEQLSISAIRDAQHQVLHYVAVFSNIQALKDQRRRLEHLATHDPLTGLLNRAEFERRCEAAIAVASRMHKAVAILFVDLDAFKIVNDSYSHAIGDRLLQKVAERIRRQLGGGDVAGRIGGDEFTVLLDRLELREDAGVVAGRLLAKLSEPVVVDDCEMVLSASIGIAGYPLDGADALTLIANADAAMYAAKNGERNTFRFYTPIMQADARQRLLLVSELRRALAENEFRLCFQPSIDLRSGQVVAAEALLRWQHPRRGELLPSDFIPVAESLGLIRHIDEWVLQAACAQIKAWDEIGMSPIRVAVNVSARWFGHAGFVEHLDRTLRAHGVAPGRLALEITEGTMLRLGDDTVRTLQALHALGVEVVIDDFGTGYSSMAYLKLPSVSRLKIDRSFVTGLPQDANDVAIVKAIMAMARSLGLDVTAEGIETQAQHDFLLLAGCSEGQGYLYAAGLPPAALERMLGVRRRSGTAPLSLVPPKHGS
ncbi:putative bifunctional diguanylate cyclase/phosphodiesterase [Dyella sp. A6]|uniref:putative bifunctional diguanylate cyclase/phosphodiesterase n=1 Tax=Dyella aluminiiresistens TaxID=3069105 RepID=UPI002E769618|nr:EAL domain-containing protein [Dyella sp. A6]